MAYLVQLTTAAATPAMHNEYLTVFMVLDLFLAPFTAFFASLTINSDQSKTFGLTGSPGQELERELREDILNSVVPALRYAPLARTFCIDDIRAQVLADAELMDQIEKEIYKHAFKFRPSQSLFDCFDEEALRKAVAKRDPASLAAQFFLKCYQPDRG